jgi:hypothetical protein
LLEDDQHHLPSGRIVGKSHDSEVPQSGRNVLGRAPRPRWVCWMERESRCGIQGKRLSIWTCKDHGQPTGSFFPKTLELKSSLGCLFPRWQVLPLPGHTAREAATRETRTSSDTSPLPPPTSSLRHFVFQLPALLIYPRSRQKRCDYLPLLMTARKSTCHYVAAQRLRTFNSQSPWIPERSLCEHTTTLQQRFRALGTTANVASQTFVVTATRPPASAQAQALWSIMTAWVLS